MADKVLGVMDDNGTKVVLAYKGYLGKLVVMQIEPDAETYEDGSYDARIIAQVHISVHEESPEHFYIDYTIVAGPNEVGDEALMKQRKDRVVVILHNYEEEILDFIDNKEYLTI
nr:MAG TPA: hypothetical protein [Caudoviricetes sp.]